MDGRVLRGGARRDGDRRRRGGLGEKKSRWEALVLRLREMARRGQVAYVRSRQRRGRQAANGGAGQWVT